jgi:hypothetical protein
MHLMDAYESLRLGADGCGDPAAILLDGGRLVARAAAGVEACIDALGHPALAPEEAVGDVERF